MSCIPCRAGGHTITEVMTMKQGEQESTKELEARAREVETFNNHWTDGEFLGPNTMRQKKILISTGQKKQRSHDDSSFSFNMGMVTL